MLSRRSFFAGAGAIALAQLLSGCAGARANLKVLLLQSSIPPQLLNRFRKQIEVRAKLSFQPQTQLKDLYTLLDDWQNQAEKSSGWQIPLIGNKTPTLADLVTIGHYWLADAVKSKLIEPLDVEQFANWELLPSRWQNLARLDKDGSVWGAPYRWGNTMIVYRRDQFQDLGWAPSDWSDLWREEVRDRISILDQPREVIGLTLKKLGYSYNTNDLGKVPDLKSELLALQRQIKFYSSDNYLQPLILGDVWLAVGWSTDILPLIKRYSNLEAVVPRPGTSLWADLWVKPRQKDDTPDSQADLAANWIDFCWLPESASQISLLTSAASPVVLGLPENELPQDLQNNLLLQMEGETLDNSEFILPLPPEVEEQYQQLWREVRLAGERI